MNKKMLLNKLGVQITVLLMGIIVFSLAIVGLVCVDGVGNINGQLNTLYNGRYIQFSAYMFGLYFTFSLIFAIAFVFSVLMIIVSSIKIANINIFMKNIADGNSSSVQEKERLSENEEDFMHKIDQLKGLLDNGCLQPEEYEQFRKKIIEKELMKRIM